MLTFPELEKWLQAHDRTSYYGLRTLRAMQGDKLLPFASEILGFVSHHYRGDALADYAKRVKDLRLLQAEFEKIGMYSARSYAEVKPVDDEAYKLALLLSFICTNHRFEILKELKCFLNKTPSGARRLLSIGYGTGYELKLAKEALPDWTIEAFDNSKESFAYASDLLGFFECGPITLRTEYFPLEMTEELDPYRGVFGKIVICELLEHLENPMKALTNLREVLDEKGQMFLTMAINIAQEDHVFLYSSPQQAREQVLACGYRIVREILAPAVVLPFKETDREKIFRKGNYICIVEKSIPESINPVGLL
jgi:SAM-dependent methyltransferase